MNEGIEKIRGVITYYGVPVAAGVICKCDDKDSDFCPVHGNKKRFQEAMLQWKLKHKMK